MTTKEIGDFVNEMDVGCLDDVLRLLSITWPVVPGQPLIRVTPKTDGGLGETYEFGVGDERPALELLAFILGKVGQGYVYEALDRDGGCSGNGETYHMDGDE